MIHCAFLVSLFNGIVHSCFTIFWPELQEKHAEYNLFGTIVHSGFSPDSGHYYAYIKVSFNISCDIKC